MRDLSVIIPARNEEFLNHTVDDVLAHIEADTEVIVVLDGAWPMKPIPDNDRLTIVHMASPVGQRAACNIGARVSQSKYVMKLDAHCAVGQGFDRIMIEDMQPDWTMVPTMYNLHVFNWVCPNGHRRYQSPSGPCEECGEPTEKEIVWHAKTNPETTAMRFDSDMKFQYWRQYKKRQQGDLVDTMSLLGACWLLERDRYHDLNICDEGHGGIGWGQQGTEVSCKTWLSGGRLVCTKKTWFAHMFRTQGGDFGFPYPISGRDVRDAREYSKDLWLGNNWDKAIYPMSYILEKFWPIPGWTEEDLRKLKAEEQGVSQPVNNPSKAILYYTDNRLDPAIMEACQKQIEEAGLPIISVSLQPMEWGQNIVIDGERGHLTLHRQILAGLEKIDADIVFFAEHDVLYHKSHWDFTPERADRFYYNTNVWKVRAEDGHAVWTDDLQQSSGLCAYRDLLLEQYRRRVQEIEEYGFDRHYEPGEKTGPWRSENWQGEWPNLDIRHKHNMTATKWHPSEFRNKRYARGWKETDSVEPWYKEGGFIGLLSTHND